MMFDHLKSERFSFMQKRQTPPPAEIKQLPIQRMGTYITDNMELPIFELANVPFPENYLKELDEESKNSTEIGNEDLAVRQCIYGDPWRVLDGDLIYQSISIHHSRGYITLASRNITFIYNIKTNQHYYLLHIDTVVSGSSDCIMTISESELRIWNLNSCKDLTHGIPEFESFKIDLKNKIHKIKYMQRFPNASAYQLIIVYEPIKSQPWDRDRKRHVDLISVNPTKDRPVVKQKSCCDYEVGFIFGERDDVQQTCQILSENEFLQICYDDKKRKTYLIICKINFDALSIDVTNKIELSILGINDENYYYCRLSSDGKYLVVICYKESLLKNPQEYVLTSFAIIKNEKGQYNFKKLAQIESEDCPFATSLFHLSTTGYMFWVHQSGDSMKKWNLNNNQLIHVDVAIQRPFVRFIYRSDQNYVVIRYESISSYLNNKEKAEKQHLSIVEYDDPRIMLEARDVLEKLSNDVLGIVAGYISKNTSTFYTRNVDALSQLTRLDVTSSKALAMFFTLKKQGKTLDVCAREALEKEPNPDVAELLNKILMAHLEIKRDAPALPSKSLGA